MKLSIIINKIIMDVKKILILYTTLRIENL